MNQTALINGEVISVNSRNEVFEACLIEDNKIAAIGTTEEIKKHISSSTKVIDLHGRSVLPGLIDAHMHLFLYGNTLMHLNCKEPAINSIQELLEKLAAIVQKTKNGQIIRVFGFNELMVEEQRYPTIQELNKLTEEHPIVITRTCGHIGVVNSAALKLADIDAATPNPQGGTIEKDRSGKFTGRLIENAFLQFNQYATYSQEELFNALTKAQEQLFANGITSVHDAGGFDENSFRIMQIASNKKQVKVRIYAMIASLSDCENFTKNMLKAGVMTHTGNNFFKIGPAKLFTDGSSTGPTIATREPYTSDGNNYGYLMYTEDELFSIFSKAHQNDYQITVHAQGDKAIEQYLSVIERLLHEHPRDDHRHRVEHLGICPPDLQEKAKALNVIPILNPSFPYEFGESYIRNYGERTHYMYAARDLLNHGIITAAGSDAPITTVNPFVGIYTAVARLTRQNTAFGQQQKVSLMDAIRMYTYNAAYASFDETIKGSIEAGKLADLVILNTSLLNCPIEKITEIKVDVTMLDGEIVYEKNDYRNGV
ncbi:amidohydrolase [Neobacillus drentensis]|uniref:amidohydrolase n=1 Tax=Neobacillus drentensis TaxID=220684 RepID=UPI002863EDF1|nr:amidohydrolase [Neobacillus drentensis]MDR7237639.1 putative amidohydrolase YtcJ [Neobacillus drentensis]